MEKGKFVSRYVEPALNIATKAEELIRLEYYNTQTGEFVTIGYSEFSVQIIDVSHDSNVAIMKDVFNAIDKADKRWALPKEIEILKKAHLGDKEG